MAIESVMDDDALLHVFSFLDWRDLKSVSEVSPRFQNLAENRTLHKSTTLELDVSEYEIDNEFFMFVFRARNIADIKITDKTRSTKKELMFRSLDVTRLLGRLSPIADNIERLRIFATVSESSLGVLQIFQNLRKLKILDYFPVYDELYDQKNRRPCLGYSDYCRLRDTWSLESLVCLSLEGRSWTLMGSLLRKTNKGLFRSLCCYHTDRRDLRVRDITDGNIRVREKCNICNLSCFDG